MLANGNKKAIVNFGPVMIAWQTISRTNRIDNAFNQWIAAKMAYDFRGKTALVTGASRGIGKEVTKQLVKCGAKVYALARNRENLDALTSEIPGIETICVDVANWNETKRLVEELDDIDLLVNNAGIVKPEIFGEITEELIDSVYSMNFKPALNVSQVFAEKLKKKGKPGAIVNVSSVVSLLYIPNIVVYATGKAALDKLTKLMAIELAPFKIRVNSVNPTVVQTDMTKRLTENKELTDTIKKKVPLNDICSAQDIADSILFLLSDKARMITGTILAVDGGQCSK